MKGPRAGARAGRRLVFLVFVEEKALARLAAALQGMIDQGRSQLARGSFPGVV